MTTPTAYGVGTTGTHRTSQTPPEPLALTVPPATTATSDQPTTAEVSITGSSIQMASGQTRRLAATSTSSVSSKSPFALVRSSAQGHCSRTMQHQQVPKCVAPALVHATFPKSAQAISLLVPQTSTKEMATCVGRRYLFAMPKRSAMVLLFFVLKTKWHHGPRCVVKRMVPATYRSTVTAATTLVRPM